MLEVRKTSRIRGETFIDRYFRGRVLDVGCGKELFVPHAVPFDLERPQGDASGFTRVEC